MGIMACVSQAGGNRPVKLLGREMTGLAFIARMPPDQSCNDSERGHRVYPKWCGQSPRCDDNAGEGRAHRAADIQSNAIESNGGLQLLSGH